jgi:hypothetical protein
MRTDRSAGSFLRENASIHGLSGVTPLRDPMRGTPVVGPGSVPTPRVAGVERPRR